MHWLAGVALWAAERGLLPWIHWPPAKVHCPGAAIPGVLMLAHCFVRPGSAPYAAAFYEATRAKDVDAIAVAVKSVYTQKQEDAASWEGCARHGVGASLLSQRQAAMQLAVIAGRVGLTCTGWLRLGLGLGVRGQGLQVHLVWIRTVAQARVGRHATTLLTPRVSPAALSGQYSPSTLFCRCCSAHRLCCPSVLRTRMDSTFCA